MMPVDRDDERVYVRVLVAATRLGFVLMLAGFAAYATGLLEPQVPIERLPMLWSLPADRFAEASGIPRGWGWVSLIGRGDLVNLMPAALIASATLAGVGAVGVHYMRRGQRLLAFVALLQVAVILLAASGWFAPS